MKNANAWLMTVSAFVDWTCVCGKAHRVRVPSAHDLVCPQCQRTWAVTLTGNVRISYTEVVAAPDGANGQLSLFSSAEATAPQAQQADNTQQEGDSDERATGTTL